MSNKSKSDGINADHEDRTRFEMNREVDRTSREASERQRDGMYDMPDFDNFDYQVATVKPLKLLAPPARIDPKYGKMVQYWADGLRDNGARINELKDRGYNIRDPKTVPLSFKSFTQEWQMTDVIMVGGRHILMETPEFHAKRIEKIKREKNMQNIRDIQATHGRIVRDGVELDYRDNGAGSFSQLVEVNTDRNNYQGEGGGISFAD